MTINRTVTKKLEDDDLVITRNRRRTPTQLILTSAIMIEIVSARFSIV